MNYMGYPMKEWRAAFWVVFKAAMALYWELLLLFGEILVIALVFNFALGLLLQVLP